MMIGALLSLIVPDWISQPVLFTRLLPDQPLDKTYPKS